MPILPAAMPVVEVRIGGKGPYKFAIDTGAQGHGRISTALAEELGTAQGGRDRHAGAGQHGRQRAPMFGASEVSVGGVSFRNVDLVALSTVRGPQGEWDGVLGNELLTLLPLTLDYGNARRGSAGRARRGAADPLRPRRSILPVAIAGKEFAVHFDSGNGAGGLFLDEDAAKALPLAGEPSRAAPRA